MLPSCTASTRISGWEGATFHVKHGEAGSGAIRASPRPRDERRRAGKAAQHWARRRPGAREGSRCRQTVSRETGRTLGALGVVAHRARSSRVADDTARRRRFTAGTPGDGLAEVAPMRVRGKGAEADPAGWRTGRRYLAGRAPGGGGADRSSRSAVLTGPPEKPVHHAPHLRDRNGCRGRAQRSTPVPGSWSWRGLTEIAPATAAERAGSRPRRRAPGEDSGRRAPRTPDRARRRARGPGRLASAAAVARAGREAAPLI